MGSTSDAARSAGVTQRLYKNTRANPLPDVPIDAIDFVSTMSGSAPFLIAITTE